MILDQIDKEILKLAEQSDIDLKEIYKRIDEICLINSNRILSAFIATWNFIKDKRPL